jgi:hypothetical protein
MDLPCTTMKICNWKDCIQDRHKWKKKSLRRPKHSMNEVVEPEEEEERIFQISCSSLINDKIFGKKYLTTWIYLHFYLVI